MPTHTYELSLHGHDGAGNQWANVHHYLVEDGGSEALKIQIAAGLADSFKTLLIPILRPCLPLDVVVRAISCRAVPPNPSATAVVGLSTDNDGTRPTVSESLNVGPQIAWFPVEDGRTVGKTFLPGIAVGDAEQGSMLDELITAVVAYITAMITDISFTVLTAPMTASLAVFRKSTLSYIAISSGQVRPRLGSQRKRTVPTF